MHRRAGLCRWDVSGFLQTRRWEVCVTVPPAPPVVSALDVCVLGHDCKCDSAVLTCHVSPLSDEQRRSC